MDILCILISSACGFAVGASTVALFAINGNDWGEHEKDEHETSIDVPAWLRQAE